MSPTHSNKGGVRYRYYVSHAVLQGRKTKRGAIARVPGPELETTITSAVRRQLEQADVDEQSIPTEDRELIEQYVDRAMVKPDTIEVWRITTVRQGGLSEADQGLEPADTPSVIILPWKASTPGAAKGVLYAPPARSLMSPETRKALLEAIAKARVWIEDLVAGRVDSLADIAWREKKLERHVRLLAPLAFVPPPLVSAIIEGSVEPNFTVTSLASKLPLLWGE